MIWGLVILMIGAVEFSGVVPNANVEKVAGGFGFTEGPVWVEKGGYLLFSDIPADTIFKYEPETGKVSVFRKPSGNSNGLTLDKQGRLLACEHGNRCLSRTDASGKASPVAAVFDGKKLNSPNDVVVRKDGSIYFTDPPYGINEKDMEQPCCGVYRLSPYGKLSRVIEDFNRPNGLAFSPDEKTLYVADSSELKLIRAYDVLADGKVANGRLFAELKDNKPGVPDGMKVDCKGNVFSTGPGGVWVFTADGRHLGTIPVPEVCANCAWGDKDGKTLYMTASTGLYKVRVTTGR